MSSDETDGLWTKTTSPDGAYVWVVDAHEARMSHWIFAGSLMRTSSNTAIFTPPSSWSFEDRTWTSKDALRLVGRCYPGTLPAIVLTLDVHAASGTIEIVEDAGKRPAPPAPPEGAQSFDVLLGYLAAFARAS